MKIQLAVLTAALFISASAHAIDEKYRQKLERSGCTQVSEAQGCNINKTKAENAKAGFGTAPVAAAASTYAGTWIARNSQSGQTVATIRVDKNNRVTVNGKAAAGKLSDGALVFRVGFITYTIQGDPRVQNESSWYDSDAKNSGPIRRQ
jgi:ABC-type lipoprotein release transport system permease subunit